MKPKKSIEHPQEDLFRLRLDNMINASHALVKLSKLIDWSTFEEEWGALFTSKKGAPAIRTRLIAGLHYLKHLYALSDEHVVERWVENPYWQCFCGEEYFQHQIPIHPTSMTKWRNRLGEAGVEKLLSATIEAGFKSKTIQPSSVKKVTVDTTVQEKNVTFPTDSKLLEKARQNLVGLCQQEHITLRQNYNRICPRLAVRVSRYAHAKQFKRMRKALKKLAVRVGRVVRDIERQLTTASEAVKQVFERAIAQAKQLLSQKRKSKNKLYSLHAPETECISKGKAHKPYEFGVKASFAVTHKEGFVIGAQSCPGNPYDGHTLEPQLNQVTRLTGETPDQCFVDKGYRGHGIKKTAVFLSGQKRGVTKSIRKALKRRSAIEPEIGHMKSDGLLGRCYLKGSIGDAMNVVLVAAGHNLRKILNQLRICWAYILTTLLCFVPQKRTSTLRLNDHHEIVAW